MTVRRSTAAMLLAILLAAQAVAFEGLDGDAEGVSSMLTNTPYAGILLDLTADSILGDSVEYWPDQRSERVRLLGSESGIFRLPANMQVESLSMFSRANPAGGYWLGIRDRTGQYLDGGKVYPLSVPLPVPAKLFWGVTAYDPYTRSELQGKALGSFFEPKSASPADHEWINTIPGGGLLLYFSLHGFEGSLRPGDSKVIDRTKNGSQ